MFGQTFGIILDRIQCTIREYPPRTSTGALGEAILEQFRLVELIIRYDGYSNTSGTVLYSIINDIKALITLVQSFTSTTSSILTVVYTFLLSIPLD